LTKTISIRDEVYRKLLKVKREGESFSELFERLAEGANPVETLKRLRVASSLGIRRSCFLRFMW
jgi:predicted CopG family antitoxin